MRRAGSFSAAAPSSLTADTPLAKLTPEVIEQLATTPHDVHSARPSVVSLTQATELGTLYTPLEMWQISEMAHERGMKVHVDGARFANAVAALGCAPADIAWRAGVDVLSLGGTKNGLPFGEAIVFFDRELAEEFGRRRMQGGQLASKMRYLAAPWLGVLSRRRVAAPRRRTRMRWRRRLADGIADVPGTRLLAPVEANGVFVDLPLPMIAALRERGRQFYEFIGATGVRLMCAWDTTPEIVDALAADMRELAESVVIEVTGAPRA